MDADKLEELERLLKAATPGPWRDRADERYSPNAVLYGPDDTDGDFLVIGSLRGSKSAGSHSHSVHSIPSCTQALANAALIVAAINALPGLIESARRVRELEAALAEMSDCQPLPKIYKYTGTAEVDVENMFDVGHRHANGRKPYDYLKSWLSMLRPFAYATQDDSWGEMEKLLSIVMNNYVQTLVKAEAARAALQTKGPTT